MKRYKMLEFSQLGDDRGHLVVVEGMADIPFEIKRIFYIYGTGEGVIRGQHANELSEFVLINLAGVCEVLVDDGKNREIILLDKPHKGIYLKNMVWKDMYNFSKDSILLVLSSEKYDFNEYIKDYDKFKKLIFEKEI